jgi:hypothetical protein
MNCRGWNPQIALYVEGDLEPALSAPLESHLSHCVECRSFESALRESQAQMRQLRTETVDESALARVRANVLREVRTIEERRTWMDHFAIWLWGGFRWRYALLGSVALVLVAAGIWRLTSPAITEAPSVKELAVVADPVPAPAVSAPPTEIEPSESRAAVPRHPKPVRPKAAAPEIEPVKGESSEIMVQILTDDPNIVIYWLIDQTGEF